MGVIFNELIRELSPRQQDIIMGIFYIIATVFLLTKSNFDGPLHTFLQLYSIPTGIFLWVLLTFFIGAIRVYKRNNNKYLRYVLIVLAPIFIILLWVSGMFSR